MTATPPLLVRPFSSASLTWPSLTDPPQRPKPTSNRRPGTSRTASGRLRGTNSGDSRGLGRV